MKKALEAVVGNFNTIRTGRANPSILDRIMVDQFGVMTPLKRIAGITVPEASTLLISPFDPKGSIKDIEKAIQACVCVCVWGGAGGVCGRVYFHCCPHFQRLLTPNACMHGLRAAAESVITDACTQESDLGINPSNDGQNIRLNIPPLTQVRRWE